MNLEDGKVAVYSPASGEVRVIVEPALALGYLEAGYLLYGDRGSLLAIGVDLETPATTGAPVPLFFDTSGDTVTGNVMSDNGTLAYTLAAAAAAGRGCSAGTDLRGRQLVRGAEDVPLAELTRASVIPPAVRGEPPGRWRSTGTSVECLRGGPGGSAIAGKSSSSRVNRDRTVARDSLVLPRSVTP